MVKFYKLLNNIRIYSENAVDPTTNVEGTRFFHIKKDGNPQYFQCRCSGEIYTGWAASVLEETIDKELTAEIEKHFMTTHYIETGDLPTEEAKEFVESYYAKHIEPVTPFKDIDNFQIACDQLPSKENYNMYLSLIEEEYGELQDAIDDNDKVEQLDALIDILVVTMGAIRTGGFDGEGAWKEVMRTNFAKVDPETGKVRRREDGKILKPTNWQGPALAQFIK